MNNKRSSIELFIEQLEEKGKAYEETVGVRTVNICIDVSEYMELKQQAKAIHKEEVSQAFDDGEYNYFYSRKTGNDFEDGKEYYEEKFNNQQ